MKRKRIIKGFLLLLLALFNLNSCGLLFAKRDFIKASVSGELKPGMSQDEVINLIGKPNRVASRQLKTDLREIWTYKQTNSGDYGFYILEGFLTLGIWWILPIPVTASEYHFLVFSNRVLIGWDLPDPYAPDLIIEKRER